MQILDKKYQMMFYILMQILAFYQMQINLYFYLVTKTFLIL